MRGILPDVNCEGHWRALLTVLLTEEWRDLWLSLGLLTPTFADLGLANTASDREIWLTCQREQLVFLTLNRNSKGPDSLEETIRALNALDSLPVLTLGSSDQLYHERSYAERAAIRVLEIVSEIDRYKGAGRLYIP